MAKAQTNQERDTVKLKPSSPTPPKKVNRPPASLNVGQASHPGLVREENEDSFGWFSTDAGELLIVADGMGGHFGGAVAGKTAVEAFHQYVKANSEEPERLLIEALLKADREITRQAEENPQLQGMGSTLVAILIRGHMAFIIHAGDSRIYRLKNSRLELLTKDHSYIQELLDTGQMTAREAENSDMRHVITQSLGGNIDASVITVQTVECDLGDLFLLCSDGLSETVSEGKLKSILNVRQPIQIKALNLVKAALKAGGPDNVTVQLAQLGFPENDFSKAKDEVLPIAKGRKWLKVLIVLLPLILGALGAYFWLRGKSEPEQIPPDIGQEELELPSVPDNVSSQRPTTPLEFSPSQDPNPVIQNGTGPESAQTPELKTPEPKTPESKTPEPQIPEAKTFAPEKP
ncbi:MAG: protein phosphatase 2C domain-containing protein [Deltaproteobacteria bacterium]|jgi:protein phosphatase|nr:protein phosphatase 2C domain-containing protein [Deltaproteobacteria bacterium]